MSRAAEGRVNQSSHTRTRYRDIASCDSLIHLAHHGRHQQEPQRLDGPDAL